MRRERDSEHVSGGSASLRDVARRAGVSMTTVSHALSGKRHVAPETVKRIRELVPELGYVPYAAARSLQSGKSLFVGLVVPDIANPFFGAIARGVEDLTEEQGYGVILSTSSAQHRRQERSFNLLRSHSIDGLIYIAGAEAPIAELRQLSADYPVLLVDEEVRELSGVATVTADHFQGGVLAGEHLAALGHRRAAVFTGPRQLESSVDRAGGFRLSFPDAIVLEGDYTEHSGRTLALAVLDMHPEVTAVFATNDTMAFGALEGFSHRGLRVPEDISLVGFDDIDFASRITPSLTTVRQPAVGMGRVAALQLLDLIAGSESAPSSTTTLPVQLIIRESTSHPHLQ